MRRTVHPHYDFPGNTPQPAPREKKINPFLKLGLPQAAQLRRGKNQFIVGFPRCNMNYKGTDHGVGEKQGFDCKKPN